MSDEVMNNDKWINTNINNSSQSIDSSMADIIFLILILFFVVIYHEKIDSFSNSTLIVGILMMSVLFVLFGGKNNVLSYASSDQNIEGLSIISNEALQNLGYALSNGTMTVNKQFCITNGSATKCLTMDFFNRSGVAPLP